MAGFLITKASIVISPSMFTNSLQLWTLLTSLLLAIPLASLTLNNPGLPPPSSFPLSLGWLLVKVDIFQKIGKNADTSPGSLLRLLFFFYYFPHHTSALCPHRLSLHLPPTAPGSPSRKSPFPMQQLPVGISGSPTTLGEPTKLRQKCKGSENHIVIGTISHNGRAGSAC